MGRCLTCNVKIHDKTEKCPLCGSLLDGRQIDHVKGLKLLHPRESIDDGKAAGITYTMAYETNYPEVEKKRHRMKIAVGICWLCAIAAYTIMRILSDQVGFERPWDGLVGGCLLYLMFTFHVSFLGRRGYQFKMIMQTVGALLVVIMIDAVLGFHGWSLNYVLPSVFVLIDVTILILMLVNSRNWQSYIPIQILVVLLSLVGVILYAMKIIEVWYPAFIGFAIVCVIFVGTVVIGGQRSLQELRRRFHL